MSIKLAIIVTIFVIFVQISCFNFLVRRDFDNISLLVSVGALGGLSAGYFYFIFPNQRL